MLYMRIGISMIIGLYTSRVILNALGAEGYGIFNVVGGVVVMLGFFNSSIGTSTQRFLNVGMRNSGGRSMTTIFSTAINVHFIIGLITVLMLETAGIWFLRNKLVIPDGLESTAMWVYQCSVLSFFIGIISAPYNAAIVAYEKMSIYAVLSILECVLKLGVALCILYFGSNKLRLYALLLLCTSVIMRFAYSMYCRHLFKDIRYRLVWDFELLKKMMSFSGWMVFGCIADLLGTQGVNMLINIYFGPIMNAARAIGMQVYGVIAQFYTSFTISVNPQITKSYAGKEYDYCYNLVFTSTKLIFFLMVIFIIPISLRSDQILVLWLKQVPPLTPLIVNLILIEALVRSSYGPLAQVCFASGKIRTYQLLIAFLFLTTFIVTYLLFDFGASVISTFVLSIITAIIGLGVRLLVINKEQHFPIKQYIKHVWARIYSAGMLSLIVAWFFGRLLPYNIVGLIALTLISFVTTVAAMWFIGLSEIERAFFSNKIKGALSKL